MSSDFYHRVCKTPGRRTHIRWLDNGERVEVVHVTLGDGGVRSGASLPPVSERKPAAEMVDTRVAKSSKPHINERKPTAIMVDTPLAKSSKPGARNLYTPYSPSAKRIGVCSSDLSARARNIVTPLAVPGKTAVNTLDTSSEGKSVAYGHNGDSTVVVAARAKSDDDYDGFEEALAVADPYGEARLDFASSIAYYASRVYKARAGKPKSEWTQDAYLPASSQGTIILKSKRKFGRISSYAPTFNPAPEDDLFHV